MRTISRFFLRLGALGLIWMGILDSSILFLPFGNDLLVVALTARNADRAWLYALMAALGSVLGCAITDLISRKIGEAGIEKLVSPERFNKIQKRLKTHAMWVLIASALMPPPFPFTIFLVAASAMQISRVRILSAVGIGRLIRFSILAALAAHYGRQILRMAEREEVTYFVIGLAVVSVIGSVFSVAKWVRSSRSTPVPAS